MVEDSSSSEISVGEQFFVFQNDVAGWQCSFVVVSMDIGIIYKKMAFVVVISSETDIMLERQSSHDIKIFFAAIGVSYQENHRSKFELPSECVYLSGVFHPATVHGSGIQLMFFEDPQ